MRVQILDNNILVHTYKDNQYIKLYCEYIKYIIKSDFEFKLTTERLSKPSRAHIPPTAVQPTKYELCFTHPGVVSGTCSDAGVDMNSTYIHSHQFGKMLAAKRSITTQHHQSLTPATRRLSPVALLWPGAGT